MSIDWRSVRKYEDITYDQAEGIARHLFELACRYAAGQ